MDKNKLLHTQIERYLVVELIENLLRSTMPSILGIVLRM